MDSIGICLLNSSILLKGLLIWVEGTAHYLGLFLVSAKGFGHRLSNLLAPLAKKKSLYMQFLTFWEIFCSSSNSGNTKRKPKQIKSKAPHKKKVHNKFTQLSKFKQIKKKLTNFFMWFLNYNIFNESIKTHQLINIISCPNQILLPTWEEKNILESLVGTRPSVCQLHHY